ncbi:hypothetical protein CWI42_060640 [Ordospora colligata]|uniref:Uncharacterized protein n=1 Tax=Ordospora colligata OC4 TaxID=1354746 RepID=A0A0B2UKM6_9MICR|nr:uncharacterized protein M896_060640 [Ordospora colligata OC4]KHN69565.1 hypothetical protein M896_060640 [Ordospora colligata OC4]TBU15385.1 hypothetical protein CWI41_060630 [Ordospora colligata]TBU15485.1 hypothetical protein CWI40_060630 [Ordospora colligata]TBU18581.1 hypothetical protein CWI42_060640 [Ordospora colligata]
MLDRKYIVPAPVIENHSSLNALIDGMEILSGQDLCIHMDNMLCVSGQYNIDQMLRIDHLLSKAHEKHHEEWFYQRMFELILKAYDFSNKWRSKLMALRIHEKHRFRMHSNRHNELPPNIMRESLSICVQFMINRQLVYTKVDILGFCVLEMMSVPQQSYEGPDDIFYLIEYIFRCDPRILLRWANNARMMNDWALLYIENYPDFLYTELRYISNPMILREIIVQQKSHRLYEFLFVKMGMMFPMYELLDILVESYSESNAEYTSRIFNKAFFESRSDGERLLKGFIKKTKTTIFSDLFYERCSDVDGDYVEALVVCIQSVDLISNECAQKLVDSQYWPYITHEYESFAILMKLLMSRQICLNKQYEFLNSNVPVSLDNLKKVLFVSQHAPDKRAKVLEVIVSVIKSMHRHMNKCVQCIGKKIQKLTLHSTDNLNYHMDKIIQKQMLVIIYSILDILRYSYIPTKTLYTLSLIDAEIFGRKVVQEVRYDCFFIKCMNIVLRDGSGRFDSIMSDIIQMDLFKMTGYWEICVVKALNLRRLWNAAKNFNSGANAINNKNSRLYSLRNSLIHSESNFNCENLLSVDAHELECSNLLEYLNIIDDMIRLKCLAAEIEGKKRVEVMDALIQRLEMSERVCEGMVFCKESFISLEMPFDRFGFEISLLQYEEDGEQVFVQFEGRDAKVSIGRTNGKLFLRKCTAGASEQSLLGESNKPKINMIFRSWYKSSKLVFGFDDKMHNVKISGIRRIVIGSGFKGIVDKLFLCESVSYGRCVSRMQRGASFYIDVLSKIEKMLQYKNRVGVYMDNTRPYFINRSIDVEISNVIDNKNVYWRYNKSVKKLLNVDDDESNKILNKKQASIGILSLIHKLHCDLPVNNA